MDKLKRYKFKNQFWHDIQPIGVIAPDGKWVEYAEVRAKISALESENASLEKRCAELREERDTIYSDMNRIVPEQDRRIAELEMRNKVFTEYIHGYVEDIGDAEDRADRLAVIADALAVELEYGTN